jgi:hypothetical protein
MKFHGNLSGRRRTVPCERSDRRTETNISKLTTAFRNRFVNTHKSFVLHSECLRSIRYSDGRLCPERALTDWALEGRRITSPARYELDVVEMTNNMH